MKTTFFILSILTSSLIFSQKKWAVKKDIDFDGIIDTIYVDRKESKIICLLSSKKFHKIESKKINLQVMSGVSETKNGFIFENNYMRAGYSNQFRYNRKAKKMRLIGIQSYEFGDTNSNDAGGKASANLLTGDFIGEWSYFEEKSDSFVRIPTVKTKVLFKKIYLEDFDEDTYFNYCDKAYKISCKYRDKMLLKRK